MKISKSYVALTQARNNIFEKVNICVDLESISFEFNTYGPCDANRKVVGNKCTVIFHVEDVMSSHVNTKVNDKAKESTNRNYYKHVEVNTNRGKVNKYLGTTFYFTEKPKAKIKMDNNVEMMIN